MFRRRPALLQDLPYLAAGTVALLSFHYYIISRRRHFPFDYAGYHFPLLYYARDSLVQGLMPFYDAYVYSGVPFYANPQTALFYPVHLILYAFSAIATSELTGYQTQYLNLVHFAFAGVGFYALLRHYEVSRWASLVGACLLIFNGHVLSQSQHLGVIETFSWVPLSVLALEKVVLQPTPGRVALLSWCLAMPLLIGFLPQSTAIYLILALVAVLRLTQSHRGSVLARFLALGSSALIAAAIGAVVLVPLLSGLGDWLPLPRHGRMPLTQLLTLLAPNIFNEFDVQNYMGPVGLTVDYYYAGAFVIPLALIGAWRHARRVWMFITIGTVSFVMTFGPGWLVALLQSLPVVGVLIRPVTFAYFFVLSLLILAVHGLDDPKVRRFVLPAGALMIVTGMAVFAMQRGPVPAEFWAMGRLLPPFVLLAIVVALRPGRWQQVAIGLLILGDLFEVNRGRPSWAFAGDPNANTRTTIQYGNSDLLAAMRAPELAPHRVAVNQQRLGGVFNGMWRVWRVESINGFEPQLSEKYWRTLSEGLSTWSEPRIFNPGKLDSSWYGLLNIRYYLTDEKLDHPDWELTTNGFFKLYRRKEFHPRYALVDWAAIAKDENKLSATYQPVRKYAGDVRVLEYRPGYVSLVVQAPQNGAFLFISERSYPQWRADIDGTPARLWEVNDILLGLPVDGGEHRVVLRFEPKEFYFAAAISTAGVAATLMLAFAAWRRRPRVSALAADKDFTKG